MRQRIGPRIRFLATLAVAIPLLCIHRVAFWLDGWLFPAIRLTPVPKPLFIVGIPRSGTTLFHRLIAANERTFTTFPLWELLFAPALSEKYVIQALDRCDRVIGRPGARTLGWIERRLSRSLNSIHETTLQSPEEDYLGLLAFGGCFLSVLAWPHSDRVWRLGYFSRELSPERKLRLLKVYRGLLTRHLIFRDGAVHIVSKNPSLTSWLPELAKEFPDACIVGLRRSPVETLPSQLSSLRDGLAWFGHDATDPRVVDRFVSLFVFYANTLQRCANKLPANRFQLVEYESLRVSSFDVVTDCLATFGYPLPDPQRRQLAGLCERADRYQSQHHYTLDEFQLTAEQIATAFGERRTKSPQHRDRPVGHVPALPTSPTE